MVCDQPLRWQHQHGASIARCAQFLSPDAADLMFRQAQAWPHWRQHHISLFGRRVAEPRLGIWFADPGVHYRYSGRDCEPLAWPEPLHELRRLLEASLQQCFNGVLCNRYRDGNDHMGWHSDDEPGLGKQPLIASVSLGAGRDFVLRRKDDHRHKISLHLQHGSLLLMAGTTQQCWQHALPRRRQLTQERINLTFRLLR